MLLGLICGGSSFSIGFSRGHLKKANAGLQTLSSDCMLQKMGIVSRASSTSLRMGLLDGLFEWRTMT